MGGIPEVGSPCGLTYLLSSSFSALALHRTSSHVRSSLRGSSRSMTRSTALLLKSAFVSRSSLRTRQSKLHTRNQPMVRPHPKRMGSCSSWRIQANGSFQGDSLEDSLLQNKGPAGQRGLEGQGGDQRGEEPGPVWLLLGLRHH